MPGPVDHIPLMATSVQANAVFIAALISQIGVIVIYKADIISFLWLNVIGVGFVVGISLLLQTILGKAQKN